MITASGDIAHRKLAGVSNGDKGMDFDEAFPESPESFAIRRISFADKSIQIAGRDGDPYFDTIDQQLYHCEQLAAVLFHCVKPGSTIIDVGANVGLTTVLAHRLVRDARILSVEPSRVYDCLVETVRLNDIPRQTSHRMCAGSANGEAFLVEPKNSSASFMSFDTELGRRVPVCTIDTLVKKEQLTRVDFVKIDVEGCEPMVLDGMTRVLDVEKPLIMMEFNSFTLAAYGRRSPRDVLDFIVQRFGGFVAHTDKLEYIKTEDDVLRFFLSNMTQRGCVDDIIFSPSPERIAAFGLN